MTGIANLERRGIGEISGGQMQRALLCRALIGEPHLLILDEPTTYVDSGFESELYGLLRELNDGMSIVMVSHDTAALSAVAKRVVRIDRAVIATQKN
jgi:zinc transport system ATP-binding protein